MNGADIQGFVNLGYAFAATALGTPFAVYRSSGSNPIAPENLVTTLPAVFTSAKASGFKFDKALSANDEAFVVLADAGQLRVGDYLVGSSTYYIAAMPPLLEVVAILCGATLSLTRPAESQSPLGGQAPGSPSQPGSTGTAWGYSDAVTVDPMGVGSVTLKTGIPGATVGTTGRATGSGELPSDAPGPSRWKLYLNPVAFPQGSVRDRDIATDGEDYRYQISAAVWTPLGYRVETVRLEN